VRVRTSDLTSTLTNGTGGFSITLPEGIWTLTVTQKGGLTGAAIVSVQGAPISNVTLVVRQRR
jgi:hypothetical protein